MRHIVSSLAFAALTAITIPCSAENVKITVTGQVMYGTLDSAIMDENDNSLGFLSDSPIAKKIFSKCVHGDTCKVTAIVDENDEYNFIKKVIKVEKMD